MEGDESVPLIRNEGQGPSLRGVESPMKQRSACGNVVRRLFRRKRIEDILSEQSEDHEAGQGLSRSLTSFDLIAYGLGSTIGAGLFVVTGKAAKQMAGPAVTISFLLAAFSGLLSAFCYAEFATRVPVAGSAYSYAYVCFGELVAWFIGWNLTLEYGISASAVARGWADYAVSFMRTVGVSVPKWVHEIELGWPILSKELSPLAMSIVLLCSALLLFGVSESARLNLIITCINGFLILFIIVTGSSKIDEHNYDDFVPYGTSGVLSGAGFVFFSYIGFDCVCTLSEELKNPKRDLPIAIVGTLVTVSALYIAVSFVLTGMVKYSDLDMKAPLADAFLRVDLPWAAVIVAFGTVTILSSTTLCSLFGQPRVFFAMAKDGLMHRRFSRINPKTKVPEFGTYVCGAASAVLAFCFDIDSLTGMISVGTLMAFMIVSLGTVVLRYEGPGGAAGSRFTGWLALFLVTAVASNVGWTTRGVPKQLSLLMSALSFLAVLRLSFLPQNPVTETKAEGDSEHAHMKGSIFACPLVPWIPCLGIYINLNLILSLEYNTLLRLLVWTAIGMLIYFGYGMKNSKLNAQQGLQGGERSHLL